MLFESPLQETARETEEAMDRLLREGDNPEAHDDDMDEGRPLRQAEPPNTPTTIEELFHALSQRFEGISRDLSIHKTVATVQAETTRIHFGALNTNIQSVGNRVEIMEQKIKTMEGQTANPMGGQWEAIDTIINKLETSTTGSTTTSGNTRMSSPMKQQKVQEMAPPAWRPPTRQGGDWKASYVEVK